MKFQSPIASRAFPQARSTRFSGGLSRKHVTYPPVHFSKRTVVVCPARDKIAVARLAKNRAQIASETISARLSRPIIAKYNWRVVALAPSGETKQSSLRVCVLARWTTTFCYLSSEQLNSFTNGPARGLFSGFFFLSRAKFPQFRLTARARTVRADCGAKYKLQRGGF